MSLLSREECLQRLEYGKADEPVFQGINIGEIDFSRYTFDYPVNFSGAIFKEPANFSNTIFKNVAYFNEADFLHKADFKGAVFEKGVNFQGAIFHRESDFFKFLTKNSYLIHIILFFVPHISIVWHVFIANGTIIEN